MEKGIKIGGCNPAVEASNQLEHPHFIYIYHYQSYDIRLLLLSFQRQHITGLALPIL